jgi:predicted transcriptional regulator of viral defense system
MDWLLYFRIIALQAIILKYNAHMTRRLGQLEATALAYFQMRNRRIVKTGDLVAALRMTAKQERELLSRMARARMIANVRRGLYLVPAKLPFAAAWVPDDAAVINALMADKRVRYQITGPNAFNRYGYDEQIPAGITIYNNIFSSERRIGQVSLTLIKVNRNRLGGVERVPTPSGQTLVYSSRARTLVDAIYDWSRFDSLPRAYGWIQQDIEAARVKPDDLAEMAILYGNLATIRRIGALLEQMGCDRRVLRRLEQSLTTSTAKIPLVPGRSIRGILLKRWGIVVNG